MGLWVGQYWNVGVYFIGLLISDLSGLVPTALQSSSYITTFMLHFQLLKEVFDQSDYCWHSIVHPQIARQLHRSNYASKCN